PGRERVGGEALMHQRERALEVGIAQVRIIGAELVGEEHALVDHGAARDRDRVVARRAALVAAIERARDRLPQNVEPALELVLVELLVAETDEDLPVPRLCWLDGFA